LTYHAEVHRWRIVAYMSNNMDGSLGLVHWNVGNWKYRIEGMIGM
jgi:hypothetical protein